MDKVETLHKLCHALMAELEEYAKKIEKADGMNAGDLEAVDKLSHALKSIKTTIAMIEAGDEEEDGYSERYMPYYGGMSYADGNSRMGGSSYAGRRNARRDSMGRYSSRGYSYDDEVNASLKEIRELAQQLPEDHRRKIERAMDGMM